MSFWDASAIVPLCVEEPSSQQMWALLTEDSTMIAWWETPIELAHALARSVGAGTMTIEEMQHALRVAEKLRETWVEIVSSDAMHRNAMTAVRNHALPFTSAIQLAAALTWTGYGGPRNHTFVSLDPTLRKAATHEGFAVAPPTPT